MVDVPLKPRSTRQSTVASSSRARMARVRSSCGTRTVEGLVTRVSVPYPQQTVKPDFKLSQRGKMQKGWPDGSART